jgi:hypothetical protein
MRFYAWQLRADNPTPGSRRTYRGDPVALGLDRAPIDDFLDRSDAWARVEDS